jgi:transposase-like protein
MHTVKLYGYSKAYQKMRKALYLKSSVRHQWERRFSLRRQMWFAVHHCESRLFVRNGKRGTEQKYKCKACCKVFTAKTGTTLHRLQKPEKFELYRSLMLESYYPIKQIAKKVGISIQTAFDWRHKILSGTIKDDKSFKGITEIDDIWFLYSQKGRKGLGLFQKAWWQ